MTTTTEPLTAMLSAELLDLVERSHDALLAGARAPSATSRYVQAQEGALRAAAAILLRVAPRAVGSRPRSAWEALSRHAPEFTEAAQFFTMTARRGRSAQAGIVQVSSREADDLLREAESFLARALVVLGLPARPAIGGLRPVVTR